MPVGPAATPNTSRSSKKSPRARRRRRAVAPVRFVLPLRGHQNNRQAGVGYSRERASLHCAAGDVRTRRSGVHDSINVGVVRDDLGSPRRGPGRSRWPGAGTGERHQKRRGSVQVACSRAGLRSARIQRRTSASAVLNLCAAQAGRVRRSSPVGEHLVERHASERFARSRLRYLFSSRNAMAHTPEWQARQQCARMARATADVDGSRSSAT